MQQGREARQREEVMDNYLQRGEALDLIAPSGGVVSGRGVLIGAIFAVAAVDAAATALFAGYTEGVFQLAAATHASTQAIAAGTPVYWDDSGQGQCTATATGNTVIGVAVEAKVSTVATGQGQAELPRHAPAAGAAIADALDGRQRHGSECRRHDGQPDLGSPNFATAGIDLGVS
jgi:predicted RecA/RadA family phage recombinase